MKKGILVLVLAVSGFGCVQATNNSSACKSLGLESSEEACVQASGSSCQSVTAQGAASSSQVTCWKKASVSANNFTPTTTTGGSTSGGNCSGNIPWTIGAWSPEKCAAGVSQLTRTVTCMSTCTCNSPNPTPATITSCVADLYKGKHYVSECSAAGGAVEWMGTERVCYFQGAGGCPSGWDAVLSSNGVAHTSTASVGGVDYPGGTNGVGQWVTTGQHNRATVPVESREICTSRSFWKCWSKRVLTATLTGTSCY